jgi:hypothetical protein
MLRDLRKKTIKKETEEIDSILGKDWVKWYLERNYLEDNLFKYLFFLRIKGADVNKFLDAHKDKINNKKNADE